eukprot:snap_masked-scaffold_3-processed-gene-11.28-mRNA-1 protein AED:1.00 eAED:1.00 QI:0/0/0/0/1/1/2/0/470
MYYKSFQGNPSSLKELLQLEEYELASRLCLLALKKRKYSIFEVVPFNSILNLIQRNKEIENFLSALEIISVLKSNFFNEMTEQQLHQLSIYKNILLKLQKQNKPHLNIKDSVSFLNKNQILRLYVQNTNIPQDFFCSSGNFAASLYIANEFGLFNSKEFSLDISIIGNQDVSISNLNFTINSHGRVKCTFTMSANTVSEENVFWVRFSVVSSLFILPVYVLPINYKHNKVEKITCSSCRCLGSEKTKTFLYCAPGDLGIGGKLWDSAIIFQQALEENIDFILFKLNIPQNVKLIELGAGTGALSIYCQKLFKKKKLFMETTITDLEEVIPLIKQNILLNSLDGEIKCKMLPWGSEPKEYFDIVLMSDVIYEPKSYDILLKTLLSLSKTNPNLYILWGHRHRNPMDYKFFFEFIKYFSLEVFYGPGPSFKHCENITEDIKETILKSVVQLTERKYTSDISVYLSTLKFQTN